jgi:Domain of unknown function (DUF4062)
MRFEHDLLISYAHIDDQTLTGEHGWVSQLHRLLEIRVAQLFGETPKIWRDPKLQGNDYFADTILDRLPNIAALVSVVSPRYVQSEWCNRELKEFCRAAEKSGGVRVADKARIFKVVKTPVQRERLPEEVQPMLGYEFFVYDEKGRARELAQEYGPGADRAFLTKLDDLAYDIAQLLELMQHGNGGPAPEPGPSKGTVFLAETSFDLKDEREAIKRDLVRNGYEVLPDRPLPLIAPELDSFVREQLSRSKLSIHLIGRNYGIVPEGAEQSVVQRQQDLASHAGGLTSVIWLAPGVEVEDVRQRAFIEHLNNDADVHVTAEVLQVPIEELKTLVHRKLAPPPAPVKKLPAAAAPRQEVTRVYLLCDQQDLEATRPLEDFLFGRGLEVILPLFDEDEAAARAEHEENLQSCDVLLLYYGAAGELWLRRKLRELQKSAGLGREKPWLGRAIYVGPPATPQKERFRTLEATLIHEPPAGFDPAALESVLGEWDAAKVMP